MKDVLGPICQVAYVVPDPVEAAIRHSKFYGSGPFLFAEHVPVENFIYRGKPGVLDHSTVFGHWGDIMIEFFVQHNDAPSHSHDMFSYGSGLSGLHHTAVIVDDFKKSLKAFKDDGFEPASTFWVTAGFDVAMIDTRAVNGHMLEIYESVPPLVAAHQLSRSIAGDFSNRPLVEKISL